MIPETNIRDSFSRYYRVPSLSGEMKPVPRDTYLKIVGGFIQFIIKKALDGYIIRLSNGRTLGELSIVGRRQKIFIGDDGEIKGASIDGGATRKLWESDSEAKAKKTLIYHLNEHTNGVAYSWCWSIRGMMIANKRLYSLLTTKGPTGLGRAIARMVKDHNKEYNVHEDKPIN